MAFMPGRLMALPVMDHRVECAQSCYRCLQRYGNRGHHGLLDWRLGVGFLRAMLDHRCRFGLDGDWSMREFEDYPRLMALAARELVRIRPSDRSAVTLGAHRLPALRIVRGSGAEHFVLVHPFWSLDAAALSREPLASARAQAGGPFYFVDVFDALRRPVFAIDAARVRPSRE